MKLNKKGETLIEALCALGILTLVMFSFPTVLVNINELNKAVKTEKVAYNASKEKENEITCKVEINGNSGKYSYNNIQGYLDSGFYFYEYK